MQKKKILIIDDEEHFCSLVKKNVEQAGEFEVYIATNADHGIALAKMINPDLILLDVVMPEKDGGDVVSSLSQDKSIKDIPIVFVTAMLREGESSPQTRFPKGYPFLSKTVTLGELIACIKENIR